jgi:diguanylate cyclase (GGDEF)-like protein/PAS domain S-box-containing protein
MKKLPVLARVYVTATIALAAALLIVFGELPLRNQWPAFIGLLLASLLTSVFKLRLPTTKGRSTMSPSFVVGFVSLLVLGPHQTALIAGVGALCQSTVRVTNKNSLHKILFNIACLVLNFEVAGLMYRLAGGMTGSLVWPAVASALVLAVIASFMVNSGGVAIAVALSTGQPVQRVWRENFMWSGPSYFVGAAVSVFIVEAISRGMWWLLPVSAAPIYLTYSAYRAFAGRLEDSHRHSEVIESLNEGMAVVHRDGKIALWNDALERILGITRDRAMGRSLVETLPELAHTLLPQIVATGLASDKVDTIESVALNCEAGRRIVQVRVIPFVNGVTVFWTDITKRADAEAALTQSEERYALAAAGSNDGLWDWDLAQDEIYFSPRWKTMLGLDAEAEYSRPNQWFELIHPDDLEPFKAALDAHVAGDTSQFEHEHRVRHTDETYRWVLCRGVVVRKADGQASRIAGSQTDITDRTAVQDQLRHRSLHDTLTELPNRALFQELLTKMLDRSKRHPDRPFAVLFLDIDRFKVVNDSLGHIVGDKLIVSAAKRLQSTLREGDVIARMGGDEFTLLVRDLSSDSQATLVAQRLNDALTQPFAIDGHEVFVTASIGISLSVTGYTRPEDMMRDADTAMYRAKALGKARHEIFDTSMHTRALDRLSLENDLRRAIEHGDFTLHYQPIVSLKNGLWTGFEALIRWQRAGRNVPPIEFIPIAEETGMIIALGTWVLQQACRQIAIWRVQYPKGPALGVTVNVSTKQLMADDFVQIVWEAMENSQLQPGDLRLEITETVLMENPARAEVVLRELRSLGVKLYLDDFGTGLSSLSYLHRFPVDTLKIDRSFVSSLGELGHPAFIESIVALAKTLGTKVIAEGVENEVQMNELMRLGCGEAQGFFFARPLLAATAGALLAGGDMWTSRLPVFANASSSSFARQSQLRSTCPRSRRSTRSSVRSTGRPLRTLARAS